MFVYIFCIILVCSNNIIIIFYIGYAQYNGGVSEDARHLKHVFDNPIPHEAYESEGEEEEEEHGDAEVDESHNGDVDMND